MVTDAVQRLLDAGTLPAALGIAVAPRHRLTTADIERTRKAVVRLEPGAG
ncbi:MAG TPA: hypothetical protein VLR26_01225 [Frankiaceae bacterium]|nr:hypothetical protein [Frankiaceae bacterium]